MRIPRLRTAVALAVCCLYPPAAGALTSDAFTDPFPPHPCLPVSRAPLIFQGVLCDGVACPPEGWSTCFWEVANAQPGLSGVRLGVPRMAFLAGTGEMLAVARI